MALADDLLEGGNVVTGLAAVVTTLIVWPLIRPLARPMAKTAIKVGISAYREATRLYGDTFAGIEALAKEAMEEIGPEVAKEAVEDAGADLAEGAVEEIGPELATEVIQ